MNRFWTICFILSSWALTAPLPALAGPLASWIKTIEKDSQEYFCEKQADGLALPFSDLVLNPKNHPILLEAFTDLEGDAENSRKLFMMIFFQHMRNYESTSPKMTSSITTYHEGILGMMAQQATDLTDISDLVGYLSLNISEDQTSNIRSLVGTELLMSVLERLSKRDRSDLILGSDLDLLLPKLVLSHFKSWRSDEINPERVKLACRLFNRAKSWKLPSLQDDYVVEVIVEHFLGRSDNSTNYTKPFNSFIFNLISDSQKASDEALHHALNSLSENQINPLQILSAQLQKIPGREDQLEIVRSVMKTRQGLVDILAELSACPRSFKNTPRDYRKSSRRHERPA